MSDAVAVDTPTRSLTHQQWATIMRLQCRITSIAIHQVSGVATVKHGDTTMACVTQDGHVGYAYRFVDGTYAYPSYGGVFAR
jgi:hypothetical protein